MLRLGWFCSGLPSPSMTSLHPMPHPGGRPSKLTEETKDKLLKSLRTGNYYETACNYAGIGYRTFRTWMLKGEAAKSGEYWQFQQVILEAVSQGKSRASCGSKERKMKTGKQRPGCCRTATLSAGQTPPRLG